MEVHRLGLTAALKATGSSPAQIGKQMSILMYRYIALNKINTNNYIF